MISADTDTQSDQGRAFPSSPVSSTVLILAILTEVSWNPKVVLNCISPMTNDVEHFQKYLLTICVSSWELSVQLFGLFTDGKFCFVFFLFSFYSSLHIIGISSFFKHDWQRISPILEAVYSIC